MLLRDAVRRYCAAQAESARRRLRRLFHVGRISLMIVTDRLENFGSILDESLLIGDWVAMWRPLEIFLYDWWPIRAEIRLYERLADMRVDIRNGTG